MKFLLILLSSLFLFFSCDNNATKNKDKACSLENKTGQCEDGKVCKEGVCIDPSCNGSICPEHAECINDACACQTGYVMIDDACYLDACADNPCKEANRTVCKPSKDAPHYTCDCTEGFKLDGEQCTPEEACVEANCQENATCVNNQCACKEGYVDINGACIVDLCVEPNPCREDNKTICKNLPQSPYFVCECDENFHLENGNCVSDDTSPCHPNPCTEKNKTRCLLDPDDNSKAECYCDVDYHTDGDLCCQFGAENQNGVCGCKEEFFANPGNPEECLIKCTTDTVEGFQGHCENSAEICLNGVCVNNLCADVTCPDNSTCIVRETTAQCQCNDGLHMDNNLCCMENASNVNGSCQCDTGYLMDNGSCVPEATNPCETNGNPCTELHRNACVVTGETYRCDCNVGYQDDGGVCKIITTGCGDGFVCLNNYCVQEGDRPNEQCLTNADCNWNGTTDLFCTASALGGICNGCTYDSDCPGDLTVCSDWGSCNKLCSSDNDCPSGNCTSTGMCGRSRCTTVQDCPYGSTCIEGWCDRKPCIETECSIYNPTGTCEAGKTCIYGSCVASCSPNPCTQEPMKTVCTTTGGAITCSCEAGYTENESGKCVPETVSDCPTGFTCDNGYCANRNDANFVCSNDTDCGSNTTCSSPMTLPSGKCVGCTYRSDCPHEGTGNDAINRFECIAGYCLQTCSSQSECNDGMICDIVSGFCKKKDCTTSANCPTGYICNGQSLKCERMPCTQ